MKSSNYIEYGWEHTNSLCSHNYILPKLESILTNLRLERESRILDLGCGNGFVTIQLAEKGLLMTGVDASENGVALARSVNPDIPFEVHSIYDDSLLEISGAPFDCIISLEVIEHLYSPGKLFQQSVSLLKPGGYLILSTPYHGYFKNLVTSILNAWDNHFLVDRDGGHIKFFSRKTLTEMAISFGFEKPQFWGVGRFAYVWKSMIMVFKKGSRTL